MNAITRAKPRKPYPSRRTREWVLALSITTAVVVAFTVTLDQTRTPAKATAPRVATYQGETIRWWVSRARANGAAARWQAKRADRLQQLLRRRVVDPLENVYEHSATLAAVAYGVDAATLIRKGRCESVRWTQFTNASSGAAGPWQFIGSTWASTPYAAFSPYDPFAAALAAAFMHSRGRGGEWVCP